MISVSVNQNLVYFFFLFNIFSNTEKEYHPLGELILKRFNKYPREIENLKKLYQQKLIPNHPYQYCVYAINTNEDLSPKELAPTDGFGPRMYDIYMTNLYPRILDIEKELNFFDVFEKEFLPQYELICNEMQKNFEKKIGELLNNIWKIDTDYNFYIVPNVFEVGHSFGVFRENNIYSISSPILTKEGLIEFNSQNLISNAIHEFSHSIFKKKLISSKRFQENKTLTAHIEVPGLLKKIHNTPDIYIEETYIKIVAIVIQEQLYKNSVPKEEMENKSLAKIKMLEEKGYILARHFYNELKTSKDIFKSYFKIVGSLSKK